MYSERPTGPEAPTTAYGPEAHEDGEPHVHLPPSSIWPITLAGGIAIAGLGLAANWNTLNLTGLPISILGLVIMFVAIVSWVQELRHERH